MTICQTVLEFKLARTDETLTAHGGLAQPSLLDDPGEPHAYHAVASNWPEEAKGTAEVLAWHNQRGQAEL